MFHTSAFFGSVPNTGVLTQIAGVADSILPASGSGLLSSSLAYLMGIGFAGLTAVRGQMQAPSLRDYGNLDVEPVNIGTAWESPPRFDDLSRKMIPLAMSEEWDLLAAQNDAMVSRNEYGFVWSSDGNIDPFPPKKVVQLFWNASVTLVPNKWSLLQIVLSQPLYPGRYAIVGGRMKSAGALAFRFVPSGNPTGAAWRPGGIAVQADDQLDWPNQRKGGWGKWLDFTNTTVPQIEVLSISADTSEAGVIDIVPY